MNATGGAIFTTSPDNGAIVPLHLHTDTAAGQAVTPHASENTLDEARPSAPPPAGGVHSPIDPMLGRTLGAGYEVLALVSRGGLGKIYRARQNSLDRDVAIKVLHAHLMTDEANVERFYAEIQAASRLNHPNSIAIIDFGLLDGNVPYVVMEHLAGQSLRALLKPGEPLSLARAGNIALEMLSALGEAHALGIVHRDLKPENVLVVPRRDGAEQVKVLGFGLAHVPDRHRESPADLAVVCGTPGYAAPERWLGQPVDGRTDLYAVGVVLFEMLAGRAPFLGDPAQKLFAHLTEPPPPLLTVCPDPRVASADVEDVVARALAKSPEERFSSAAEMAEALQEALFARASTPRMSPSPSIPHKQKSLPRWRIEGEAESPSEMLASLLSQNDDAQSVSVVGPHTSDRTTLLDLAAAHATARGEIVVRAAVHPSGKPVPYWTALSVALHLAGCDEVKLAVRATSEKRHSPIERAGLSELISPEGLRGLPGASRVGAVASALWALLRKRSEPAGRKLLVVLDEADRCDRLSVAALDQLCRLHGRATLLMATEHCDQRQLSDHQISLPDERAEDEAKQIASMLGERSRAAAEAIAVLGPRAGLDGLDLLCGPIGKKTLAELGPYCERDASGALSLSPLLARAIEQQIPQARSAWLHDRAFDWAERSGAPLDVRAHHAARGSDPTMAMLLLEQVGALAMTRGDITRAVEALSEALAIARASRARSGDETFDEAELTFSSALAEALRRNGQLSEAEGVLREVLDRPSHDPTRCARMLLILGQTQISTGKLARARTHLALALALGPDSATTALLHEELGRLARSSGDRPAAFASLRAAERYLLEHEGPAEQLCRVRLALCSLMVEDGHLEEAMTSGLRALEGLTEAALPALEAETCGLLAILAAHLGKHSEAMRWLEQATSRAADAGDAAGSTRWGLTAPPASLPNPSQGTQ